MQQTSTAYKTEQKQHLREKSYVWVYLGIVDRTAQKTARLTSAVTEWSQIPTGNDLIEAVYATYEQNFFRADGEMIFPPETAWAVYQGAASEGIGGSIRFTFGANCKISGVSLKFYDDALPTQFTITNGTVTNTYTYSELELDDAGRCKCIGDYSNSAYLTISPYDSSSLKGGNQRFRIQQILFGIGFYFSDKDLLSTSFTNTVSHLSDKLPTKTFSFTIDNTSRKFSADDPHSFVHFLQEQQEVDFDYGRELPNGTIETIKGGKTYLKTWTTDEQKATFNSVGYLEFMDTTYYKGHFNSGGWYTPNTLYMLAAEVFADAGITNYSIDSSLEYFNTEAPLPVEKHKNLLQLIANAGRCIFYEDRDGTFTIAPSLEDSESHNVGYTLDYADLLSSPSVGTTEFIKNVVCHHYAYTYGKERKQLAVIDSPKIGENLLLFSNPVIIDGVYYEDDETTISGDVLTGIDLYAGETLEFEMAWGYYDDNIFIHEYDPFDARFENSDKYTIEVVNSTGSVVYAKEIDTDHIIFTNDSEADLRNLKVRCSYKWYQAATITGSGAYYVKFNSTSAYKILVWGREIVVNDSEVTKNIRNIGVDRTCKNVLIFGDDWAEDNRDWMADYYNDDVEYNLEYRGEPALDCDDQIYLENNYVAKNLIRIIDGTINTAQGMTKSTLRARRLSYHEYARVDAAKVDISEVK